MSKQSTRRRRAKMILATRSTESIQFAAEPLDWIRAEAGDGEKTGPKRFRMRAYTGGPMQVGYYSAPVVIDLAGLTAKAPVPILMNHDIDKIVGHADEITVGDATLDLAGAVSGGSRESEQVLTSAKLGFPWKASVGARPDKLEFVGEGVTTKVNGKSFTGPLYVARKATLGEVSFVPMAADSKTSAKVAASSAFLHKESNMEFENWVKALFGGETPELNEVQRATLEARFKAENEAAAKTKTKPAKKPDETPPVQAAAPAFDLQAVALACEKHSATIEATAASYAGKIDPAKLAEIRAKSSEAATRLKLQALDEQWQAPALEVALVKAQRDTELALIRAEYPKGPAIHASTRDESPKVIEAAFCRAGGLRKIESHYEPAVLDAADKYLRADGASLQGMILAAARDAGYDGPSARIHRGNYNAVMNAVFSGMIRGVGFSTHSLTTLLTTVGNKFLLDGFMGVEQVWREIATVRPVNDFKTVTSFRLIDSLEYEELGPNGEIAHGTLSQESYTNAATTQAKMFTLRREDIINDDLGAFQTIRDRLGRGAGLRLNTKFWTEFLDDATFFNATAVADGGHANLVTNVLGKAGIAAGVVAIVGQKDANGHPLALGLNHILLTGPTLNPTAREWYVSEEMRDTTSSTKYATSNIYRNQFRPVMSSYITSTTAWYLLPVEAGDMSVMEVAALGGVVNPTIESADADFNTLGIQFRGYTDIGVAKKEWRGAVKSTGLGS